MDEDNHTQASTTINMSSMNINPEIPLPTRNIKTSKTTERSNPKTIITTKISHKYSRVITTYPTILSLNQQLRGPEISHYISRIS